MCDKCDSVRIHEDTVQQCLHEFWGVSLWRPFTCSPLSWRVVMGPELMVAVSLTVVAWSSSILRRRLKLVPAVQFCRWIGWLCFGKYSFPAKTKYPRLFKCSRVFEKQLLKNPSDFHENFVWKYNKYYTLKLYYITFRTYWTNLHLMTWCLAFVMCVAAGGRIWPEWGWGRRSSYRAWWHSGHSRWRLLLLCFGQSGKPQRRNGLPAALRWLPLLSGHPGYTLKRKDGDFFFPNKKSEILTNRQDAFWFIIGLAHRCFYHWNTLITWPSSF